MACSSLTLKSSDSQIHKHSMVKCGLDQALSLTLLRYPEVLHWIYVMVWEFSPNYYKIHVLYHWSCQNRALRGVTWWYLHPLTITMVFFFFSVKAPIIINKAYKHDKFDHFIDHYSLKKQVVQQKWIIIWIAIIPNT